MNRWLCLFVLVLISGCATNSGQSIAYYYFDFSKSVSTTLRPLDKPRLEIIPLVMPDYLNARGIAQRTSKHQAISANWHLWASQPAIMLDRATFTQLEKLLPDWFVTSAEEPWLIDNPQPPEKLVKLQIKLERFNGGLNNDAELAGSWTLFDQNDRLLMRHNFNETVKLQNDGYEALTTALQQGWKNICEKLATQLKQRLAQN